MPVRILNDYLQAYNIQTNYALEKTDLVKLIYETQLNDSHESFFRSNCPGSTSQTNSAESVNLSNPANPTNTNRRNSRDTTSGNHSRQRSNSVPPQNSSSQTRPRPRTQSTAPSNLQPNTFPEEFFQQFAAQLSQTINEATRQNQSSYSASAPTSPQQPASFPQPKPTDSPPSIETVVKDKLDVTKFSPKLLISILKDNHVDVKNVLEKTELLSKVQRLIDNYKADHESNATSGTNENICKICFSSPINCVILECGHLAVCMDCGKELLKRHGECPFCRGIISRVVHTFRV